MKGRSIEIGDKVKIFRCGIWITTGEVIEKQNGIIKVKYNIDGEEKYLIAPEKHAQLVNE